MTQRAALLIVEDELAVRKLIQNTLRRAGWKTIAAASGQEALSAALNYDGPISLAIVDLVMPGMGGLDFTNRLSVDRPSTKVLYISGSSGSVAMESICQRAPESMLPKPFSGAQLLERVRTMVGGPGGGAR